MNRYAMNASQQTKCPGGFYCDCSKIQERGGFQKLLESTGGAIIYRHAAREVLDKKSVTQYEWKHTDIPSASTGAIPDSAKNTKGTQADDNVIIIIHNTNDGDITSADIVHEFDVNKVSCPRCRHVMLRAKKLLASVSVVGKKDITCVCDLCTLKQQAHIPCDHCQNAIKKFKADKFDDFHEKDDLKKQLLSFLTNTKRLSNNEIRERNRHLRAYSDVDVNEMFERRGKYDQRSERIKSGSFVDIPVQYLNLSNKDLETKLQKRIGKKKVLVSNEVDIKSLTPQEVSSVREVYERRDFDSKKLLDSQKPVLKQTLVSPTRQQEVSDHIKQTLVSPTRQQEVSDHIKQTLVSPTRQQEVSDHMKKALYRSAGKTLSHKSETVLGVGTTGIMRRYHSEESLTSFSKIKDDISKKNFEYFFPRSMKTDAMNLFKTSAELIKEIRDKFLAEAEEKEKKRDELQKSKTEKEKEKSTLLEEIRRKIVWAKEKGIAISDMEIDKKTGEIILKEKGKVGSGDEMDEKSRKKGGVKKHDKMKELLLLLEKEEQIKKEKGKKDKEKKEKGDKAWEEKGAVQDKGKNIKEDVTGIKKEKIKKGRETIISAEKADVKDKSQKGKIKDKEEKRDVKDKGNKEKLKDKEATTETRQERSKKEKGRKRWEEKGDVEDKHKREKVKEKEDVTAKAIRDVTRKDKRDITRKVKGDILGKSKGDITRRSKGDITKKAKEDKSDKGKGDITRRSKGYITKKAKEDKSDKGKGDTNKKDKSDIQGKEKRQVIVTEKEEKRDNARADTIKKEKGYSTKQETESPVMKIFQKIRAEQSMAQKSDVNIEVPSKDNKKKLPDVPKQSQKDKTSESYKDVGTVTDKDIESANLHEDKVMPDFIPESKDKVKKAKKELEIAQRDTDRKKDKPGQGKSSSGKKGHAKESTDDSKKKIVTKTEVDLVNKVIKKQEKQVVDSLKNKNKQEAQLAANKKKAMMKTQELQTDKSNDFINVFESHKKEPKAIDLTSDKRESKKDNINVDFKDIKMKVSGDDILLKMVKMRKDREEKPKIITPVASLPPVKRRKRSKLPEISKVSELELDADSLLRKLTQVVKQPEVVYNTNITLLKNVPPEPMPKSQPILFQTVFKGGDVLDGRNIKSELTSEVISSGMNSFSYALSDRKFIDNGYTLLPTEKILRKMNVFRMHPAEPEFDWFDRNKSKQLMRYDSGEKLADFNENGRGRWYYKNGRLALDYYDCKDINAQQRYVIYSSGEPDDRGRSRPITVLAMFDYNGNGVVFDHAGKIRLKYNQSEGVVLDRGIGPVSHWKWHSLNDPPELQQVMIDTQMTYLDPDISALPTSDDKKLRQDDEEVLAIEVENYLKSMNVPTDKKYTPHQINMKTMKINKQFTLKVLDQKKVYLLFREGSTTLKCNLGMKLDNKDIIDTTFAEVGDVALDIEKYPAVTNSIENLQKCLQNARMVSKVRMARELWKKPLPPALSVEKLTAAASKPLRRPLQTADPPLVSKSRTPSSGNLYYNTRLI